MILSLPFWLVSIVFSLFTIKPKETPDLSLADKVAANDPSPSTAMGSPRPVLDNSPEISTPTV